MLRVLIFWCTVRVSHEVLSAIKMGQKVGLKLGENIDTDTYLNMSFTSFVTLSRNRWLYRETHLWS